MRWKPWECRLQIDMHAQTYLCYRRNDLIIYKKSTILFCAPISSNNMLCKWRSEKNYRSQYSHIIKELAFFLFRGNVYVWHANTHIKQNNDIIIVFTHTICVRTELYWKIRFQPNSKRQSEHKLISINQTKPYSTIQINVHSTANRSNSFLKIHFEMKLISLTIVLDRHFLPINACY